MNRNANRFQDFLCSLVPPVLLFAALDTLLGLRFFAQPYWPSYYYLVIFGCAFAAEQLMTVVSGWVFRGFVLGLVLGYPSRNLFEHGARGFKAMLFPEYYAPFPTELAARLKAKFEREGLKGMEAQYLHAMTRIQGRADIQGRIESLNASTLFAQNLAFSLMVICFVSVLARPFHAFTLFAGACFVVSFFRFLRVVRAHAMELFLAYDYLTVDAAAERTQRRELHAA